MINTRVMRAKSSVYALLAMVVVGVAASCQRYDEAPEPIKPEVEEVYHVYGYGYGYNYTNPTFEVFFKTEGTDYDEICFSLSGVDGYQVIPEGVYTLGGSDKCIVAEESGFCYVEEEFFVAPFTKATFEVKHIDNKYNFVFSAEGEGGESFECDWTGQIPFREPHPIYNPGEAPEPETGMEFRTESGVRVVFWNNGYDLYFIFSNDIETRQLLLSLVESDGANGLIPEGHYELGAEAPIYIDLGSSVLAPNGSDIANLVSATLDVEYVGSEYRMVVDAVDSEGTAYKADWTGRVDTSHSEQPVYHPGDEIPEAAE